jgi:hypothetical protein
MRGVAEPELSLSFFPLPKAITLETLNTIPRQEGQIGA